MYLHHSHEHFLSACCGLSSWINTYILETVQNAFTSFHSYSTNFKLVHYSFILHEACSAHKFWRRLRSYDFGHFKRLLVVQCDSYSVAKPQRGWSKPV